MSEKQFIQLGMEICNALEICEEKEDHPPRYQAG